MNGAQHTHLLALRQGRTANVTLVRGASGREAGHAAAGLRKPLQPYYTTGHLGDPAGPGARQSASCPQPAPDPACPLLALRAAPGSITT